MPVHSFRAAAGLGVSQPLLSHNFIVFIGMLRIPFSKVSSIEVAIETEALVEGGENQFVHSLFKPASSEKMLVMERGASNGGTAGSVLGGAAGAYLRTGSRFNSIIISVLDQWGLPKKLYSITGAILKKRKLSDLNAMDGAVLVESLEFAYEDLTEVTGVGMVSGGISYAVKAASSANGKAPERFTKPLEPPPAPMPRADRFTPPLE